LVKTADVLLTFSIYLAGLFASNLGQCPTLLSRWLHTSIEVAILYPARTGWDDLPLRWLTILIL